MHEKTFTCRQIYGPIMNVYGECNNFTYMECNICARTSIIKINMPAFNFKYSVFKCNLFFFNPLKCKKTFYLPFYTIISIEFFMKLNYSFGKRKALLPSKFFLQFSVTPIKFNEHPYKLLFSKDLHVFIFFDEVNIAGIKG